MSDDVARCGKLQLPIKPAMVTAGAWALECAIDLPKDVSSQELVKRIFCAMFAEAKGK